MRFGLVGTGYWARTVHAAALSEATGVELAGVWGRDPAKAAALADEFDSTAYEDIDALIDAVDAVSFAVPPDVQTGLAERAARAGRHLLLEKPIATRVDAAERLVSAVASAGVASVVFFTARFMPERRAWIEAVRSEDWYGGWAWWLGAAFAPGSPFDTPWRHHKGGLWDVGPHALSMVAATLGPVTRLTAVAGRRDVVHLVAHHESGVTSTVTVTIEAPPAAASAGLTLWGGSGTSAMPSATTTPVDAAALAVAELVANARSGRTDHSCDVRFGADVVRLLADAERQLNTTENV